MGFKRRAKFRTGDRVQVPYGYRRLDAEILGKGSAWLGEPTYVVIVDDNGRRFRMGYPESWIRKSNSHRGDS